MRVKLNSHKKKTKEAKLVTYNRPDVVYIPLVNHTNMECKSLVNVGDYVYKGGIIGVRDDSMVLPIHSSVSGVVLGIKKVLYHNGKYVDAIVIQNDFKEKYKKRVGAKKDITRYNKADLIKILEQCAVVGMGGSDFPTYIKYKADGIKTLIINGVECEDYSTSDYMMMKTYPEQILEAIDALYEILELDRAILCMKETNSDLIPIFHEHLGTYPNIQIELVKDYYPAGWERNLVHDVTGVTYDRLPTEKGVLVSNVSTMYAIYKALKINKAITEKIVTFTGDMFDHPCNVLVKIGTKASEVIEALGGYKKQGNIKFIAGGAMMGKTLPSDDVVITKDLASILVLEVTKFHTPSMCIRCGKCALICPSKLAPVLIMNYESQPEKLKKLCPSKCVECGLCSYICPAKLELREYVKAAKKKVK